MPRRDLLGPGLAAALAGLIVVDGLQEGARPWPAVLLLGGVVLAYAVGRLCALDALMAVVVPLVVGVGAVGAVLLTPDGLSGRPLAGPLGYGNANGALVLLACGALLMAAAALPGRFRWPVLLLAVSCVPVAFATGSVAAGALSVLAVLLGALTLVVPATRRAVTVGALLLPLVVLAGTVALGVSYGPDRSSPLDRAVDAGLTERRVVLWSDALDLARQEPLTGVGPGRFAVTSPTAQRDRDARWAHSLVLQTAAEEGLPGAVVLTGLLVLVGLGLAGSPTGAVLLGTVLAQAGIDYTAHTPVLPLLLAVLVGASRPIGLVHRDPLRDVRPVRHTSLHVPRPG